MRKLPSSVKSKTFHGPTLPPDLTMSLVDKILALKSSVKTDYLKAHILSKYVSSETEPPAVRRNAAIRKWLAAERDNEATSDRLILLSEDLHKTYNVLPRVTYQMFMDKVRSIILDVLGCEVPPVEALIGSFSGGASTSRNRTESHPAFKYLGEADVTSRCLEYFLSIIVEECPGWLNAQTPYLINMVKGNVLFTVPKKTDIDRVAAKEPDLNMFIQKGIGSFLRKRLRRAGINLNDQSINRSLARIGSISGDLVTLDLSSASDSVTTELVAQLLPVNWFVLLDSVRSHVTIIDGEEHRNHMFSSMGNGFTFELESLLFYSITRAVSYFRGTRGVVSVYGDDIICPSETTAYVISALNLLGFQVNLDKSCVEGSYRESCGGHYWNGFDITPFYVRKPIDDIKELINVANQLRKWAEFGSDTHVLDPEVEPIWYWLKSLIPSTLWGGDNNSSKYQLISDDEPSFILREEVKVGNTGLGGYYQWLNATWDRSLHSEVVSTSRRSISLGRYRLRKVRNNTVPRLSHYFYNEIMCNAKGKTP